MTVNIEKLENNQVKVDIVVDAKESGLAYDKACKKLAGRVNIPGFRVGHAPRAILEKHVGIDAIHREVLESLLPKLLSDVIEKNNFNVISEPSIEEYNFSDDKALTVKAKLDLRPEVELCEYKDIEVEVEKYENASNALDEELEVIRQKYSEFKPVENGVATDKHIVNIDFDGEVDGEKIKGGAAKSYMLDLGNSNFIPGFAEQIVGKESGSEFTIDVKFPDEYHDEKLKGKNAKFAIKINSIQERVLPELNDELAKKVGKFSSLDAMKEDIQKYLDNTEKSENEKRKAAKIFERLIEKTDIKIQESMVQRESGMLLSEFQQRVAMQGGNFDEMLAREGHEKVYAELSKEAETRIKNSLIIAKIAETENIFVDPVDIEMKIDEIAKMYQTDKKSIIAEIQKNPSIIQSISQQVLSQKVTQFLLDNTKVKYINKK